TPIPAMSEWGLVAFAGAAGIASLLFIRRRAKTA
ncbi:MAG: IPTL-CTERM sorting domain-containing protein, partial [Candidatus Dadabacteria bacterium]|nr:IPTL-CTERM sorting domain-containing protein [Candidatus Dadabacteria bacterium]